MSHNEPSENPRSPVSWRSAGLFVVRYGIGGAMVLAGVVVLAIDGGELGAFGFASAIGAGLSVVLLNLLYRMSVSGERDREREEDARRHLDEHGVWPDDEHDEPASRRHWILPRGVITLEREERERNRAAGHIAFERASARS